MINNMKKLSLLLALTAIQFTNAQAPTAIWQKCYGGSNDESISGLPIATSDGGFILISRTNSNNGIVTGNHSGEYDAWIIKTNNIGTVQWQRCYGGSGDDQISSIIPTADGGYLLAGDTNSNDGDVSGNHSTSSDGWIVKINAVGTILWQKCLGGDNNESLYTIIPTSDGGYIACGRADSINNGDVLGNTNYGGWVVKINNLGVIEWQKVYNNDCRIISSILQTADGGYVLCGDKYTNQADYNSDVIIFKVNQGGNIQWQNSYGGSNDDSAEIESLILTNDGGYMITAISDSNDGDVYGNHGSSDIWVFKISATGVILGQNCYGGSGVDFGLTQQTLDGGYLISGGSTSNDGNITGNNGGNDMYAIKFSATNIIQWQKCYGGTGDELGVMLQLADGTYFAAGRTNSNYGDTFANLTNATSDMFLIKLTADNLANENFAINTITTYPNPMQNILHLEIEKEFTGTIYDIAGKSLLNVNSKDIDVSSLSAGIYLLDIISEGERHTKKLIKQ
jgi:hypothetical protein